MANLSHYGLDALAKSNVVNHLDSKITSDSNIIPYSQYVSESQQPAAQNSNSSTQQDALILSVIEQLKTHVVNCTKINMDNKSVNDTLTAELERYKEQVKVLKEGQHVALKKDPTPSNRPTIVKVPKELPKVSMVNTSLKKLKHHLVALKDAFRQLKGKSLAVTSHSIDPEMLNGDVEPLNPRLLNSRPAHSDCLKHTQEEAAILREIVEQGK
nr:hypothetical protein [Tanacetum cinerariifolium]